MTWSLLAEAGKSEELQSGLQASLSLFPGECSSDPFLPDSLHIMILEKELNIAMLAILLFW